MRQISIVGLAAVLSMNLFLMMPAATLAGKTASESLQSIIDQAKPGDTITIPAGDYSGTLAIDKPLTIQGGGVRLLNDSNKPAVHIKADGVAIHQLRITDTGAKESSAVVIEADQTVLDQLSIHTVSHGIQLISASKNLIRNSTIGWASTASQVKLSNRRNGIDLYDSHENRMVGNTIAEMHDGIYMESSHRNIVEENQVERMRYGIHCMYTNGTEIRNNIGFYNMTGAMVMAVKYVEVTGNTFFKQSENVNSQGILLFDAHSSRFYDNTVEGNRVGFYIEQSSDNILMRNRIDENFIGVQFIEATDNKISDNLFSGNVIDAEARSSADNQVNGNYWDSFQGLDRDGDARSDLTNAINPFFQNIIQARPAFQLFFQSPSMVLLEELFQTDHAAWMADKSPLMAPPRLAAAEPGSEGSSKAETGVIGVILLGSAIVTILLAGVRRT